MMNKEKFYDLAFELKELALWDRMYENEFFAVQFDDGTLGYCSVMGSEGEHYALGIYMGYEGIASYRELSKASKIKNVMKFHEVLLSQNCLQCSFEDKDLPDAQTVKEIRRYAKTRGIALKGHNPYPNFLLYEPSRVPWQVEDPIHWNYLQAALVAAIDVGKKLRTQSKNELGFIKNFDKGTIPLLEVKGDSVVWGVTELPEARPVEYPSPVFCDDELLAKLRKLKKQDMTVLCEVVMLVSPERDSELEESSGYQGKMPMVAPYYPYLLLVLDQESLQILAAIHAKDYVHGNFRLPQEFAVQLLEMKRLPKRILVRDDRTQALLTSLSDKLNIELKKKKSLPELDDVEDDLFDYLKGKDEEGFETSNSDALDLGMDQFSDYFTSLDQVDSEEIPQELLDSLKEFTEDGEISPELLQLLQEIRKA